MSVKEELKKNLNSKKLSVKWQVSSDIGPSWIGSKRDICFYLNSEPISDNSVHSYLKDCLIEKLNIPETSEDDTIEGDGDLFMVGNNLIIKYAISYTIPYSYPHKYENGEVILISS